MSRTDTAITDELAEYVRSVTLREPEVLKRLRDETAPHPHASMQISAEQGQFMGMLVRLLNARKTIEAGVFTGYSSISVALALPAGGKVIACDVSDEYTSVARRYWQEAGVADKIDLRLGPALETLDGLIADGEAGTFDFAFIDADKSNYWNYYERSLTLLRPGGVVGIDNTLWHGSVVDADDNSKDTVAIREFNRRLHADDRVWISLVPIGDGLSLAMKK